ncbi:hypothetical protein [Chryseobacterium sp.]|uniref:hypothetical protein n=1 Tax=Chryseobacterium sp. TaxID=1871047 RepID=UPI00289CA757|nr:hypothetical protein [Chryseobacterium sp.]
MKERDSLILKYLADGYQINEISQKLLDEHSIKMSNSLIEKSLSQLRKQYQARTLFQLAIILKKKKLI